MVIILLFITLRELSPVERTKEDERNKKTSDGESLSSDFLVAFFPSQVLPLHSNLERDTSLVEFSWTKVPKILEQKRRMRNDQTKSKKKRQYK